MQGWWTPKEVLVRYTAGCPSKVHLWLTLHDKRSVDPYWRPTLLLCNFRRAPVARRPIRCWWVEMKVLLHTPGHGKQFTVLSRAGGSR
eukprot:1161921-Pelagomonas_calceolata.AAC.22